MYAKEGLEKKKARYRAAARKLFCLRTSALSPRQHLGYNSERQTFMRANEDKLLRQASNYYRKQHQREEGLYNENEI